jgi:hypothetical protein
MAKERVPITPELAAEVMFASDRTCCICRLEKLKVQIHHVDGDPSNNARENLAVICLHCHSDAHTQGAFVRNLTPELIRRYNSSWQEIVKLRLLAPTETTEKLELESEALLGVALDCHIWKVWFADLAGQKLPSGPASAFADVWDLMAELWIPKYRDETYHHFAPLFGHRLDVIIGRLDRAMTLFVDVLQPDFRAMLARSSRQLHIERYVYAELPRTLDSESANAETANLAFYSRFIGVIRVLRDVSREADRRLLGIVG